MNILIIVYIFIFVFLSVFWLNSLFNLLFSNFTKLNNRKKKNQINFQDKISILIPVRNEEAKISNLLESLINQTYKNIDIHILDDNSEDNTYEIIQKYHEKYDNIKVYKGEELPDGWLGKNWACQQLSQKANSDILLFLDADLILNSQAIELLMIKYKSSNVGLLSVFPTQITLTIGEKLIVPLMNYILLAMLPLTLVYKSKLKSFIAANGQLMLWRKSTYEKIGGHYSVKGHVVEDIELAKLVKKNNDKVITLLGGNYVFCRMYEGFKQSLSGFSKNFYKGFNLPSVIFLSIFSLIGLINLFPFVQFIYSQNLFSQIMILLIIFTRINISLLSNQNIIVNLLLHPFQFILLIVLAFSSVIKTKFGLNLWKGRKIS